MLTQNGSFMIYILTRSLGINAKSARCRAHNGQIKQGSPCTMVKLSVSAKGPFNVPICRICDAMEDNELKQALITEARRHNATATEISDFSSLIAKEEL